MTTTLDNTAAQYERAKLSIRRRKLELVAAGQEIGCLPPVADPIRRRDAAGSLQAFCEIYLRKAFCLKWSNDHLRIIAKIETAVKHGGLFALSMPRGYGKSAMARATIQWAMFNGYRRYCCIIAANGKKGIGELSKVKTVCESNPLLLADYPEALYPISRLERHTQRQRGQTFLGVPTRIEWLSDKLVFPTIPESQCSGSILSGCGLESGDIRGQSHQLPGGEILRPDFVFIDDPQTRESAKSQPQNETREKLVSLDVLGMAGDKKISAVMCCTPIYNGDMAFRMLDAEKHPDWQGEKTQMVYRWPDNQKLWDEYARRRADGLRAGDRGAAATQFYRQNRAAMDAGAQVAWPDKFDDDELSTLQHAWNLRLRDNDGFFAEYQSAPVAEHQSVDLLDADAIAAKVNGLNHGQVPTAANKLTLYVDVHDKLLWYAVCAWEDNFTGYIIDYSTYPEQGKRYFAMRAATKTMQRASQGAGRDGAIYAGLKTLCDTLLPRQWKRDDGAILKINMAMIDANWETEVVHKFIREYGSTHLLPAKGIGLTASSQPWDDRARKPGESQGDHCRLAPTPNRTALGRHVVVDVNHWKTKVHRFLSTAQGDAGSLSLYGRRREDGKPADPELHRMIAEHLATAEMRYQTQGRGRQVDEWKLIPSRNDNHLFDCIVGNAVLASMLGCSSIPTAKQPAPATRPTPAANRRRCRTMK